MNKKEIYDFLKSQNIEYEVIEHGAVYNMAEIADTALPHADVIAKNLFVRDDKRQNYYLITVKGDKRIDLKEFRQKHGTRRLSFADENDMIALLKLTPGSVTPFGLLNDEECKVKLFLDKDFMDCSAMIGVHPNDNTATIWLKADDLIDIIRRHGNEVNIFG